MKKHIFRLLTLLLITTLCLPSFSSCALFSNREFWSGDYRYTVANKQVTITEYTGFATNVTIPESIRKMPVVAIDDTAFHGCDHIESITIPDSVVSIGGLAFSECHSLERVTLGKGIREIDYSPFAFCDKMIYNIYDNGCYIGNDENPYFALICTTSEEIESITVHPDTVVVAGSAIESCKLLREITFPDGIVSIGSFALQYCSSLETVNIPKSLESLGTLVFLECSSIQNFVVSNENANFKAVDGSLFSHDGTRLIKYAAGRKDTSYSVPDGAVIIERSAFEKALHLTEVTLPDSVEEIGHMAFIHCENMKSIHLGNSLKTIDGAAFSYCTSLSQITIPDSTQKLSYSLFSYCDKLESVIIGSGVVSIEEDAFTGCNSLREVVFRNPEGWKVKTMFALTSTAVNVSNPEQNAHYFKDQYQQYYWLKK